MCDVFFLGTARRIDSQISVTTPGMGMTIEGSRGAGHVRAPRGRKLLAGPAGRSDAEATARKDCKKPVEGAARSDMVGDMCEVELIITDLDLLHWEGTPRLISL
jgi:hypothetical protein